jgi:8-oxo-dGTP pyrophosphatase MutT (NUDIX family)
METEIAAAKRELKEETGLDLSHYDDKNFQFLGVYDSLERDPRNTHTHWIESHVFTIQIDEKEGGFVEGLDDAEDARWFSIQTLQEMKKDQFAFEIYGYQKGDLVNTFSFRDKHSKKSIKSKFLRLNR